LASAPVRRERGRGRRPKVACAIGRRKRFTFMGGLGKANFTMVSLLEAKRL
jgi:hypothetical protein